MKKRFKQFRKGYLGIFVLIATVSCSELEKEQANVQQDGSALTLSTTSIEENNLQYLAEPMTPVLGVRWGNVGDEKGAISSELQLFVRNFTKVRLKVSLQVLVHGMLKYSASMDIGEFDLNPDEEVVFPVAAKDIPIQIVTGVGQMSVNAVATIEKKSGPVKWIAPVTPIYYQHMADYRSVETFPESVLVQEKAGLLSGLPQEKSDTKEVVGRVKNSKGTFVDITAENTRVELTDSKGQSAGFVTGMSIDVDQDME